MACGSTSTYPAPWHCVKISGTWLSKSFQTERAFLGSSPLPNISIFCQYCWDREMLSLMVQSCWHTRQLTIHNPSINFPTANKFYQVSVMIWNILYTEMLVVKFSITETRFLFVSWWTINLTMLWILFVPDLLQYMSMPYLSLGPQGLSELPPPCSCVRGRSDYCISHKVDDFLCRTVSDSEACGTRWTSLCD